MMKFAPPPGRRMLSTGPWPIWSFVSYVPSLLAAQKNVQVHSSTDVPDFSS